MSESFSGRQGGKEKQEETDRRDDQNIRVFNSPREEVEEEGGAAKRGIDLIRRWEKKAV